MKYNMLDEYLKNNLFAATKENEEFLTKELTNNVFSKWNDKLEAFTHICNLYDYVFRFYEDGRIVMEERILEETYCMWRGKTDCGHLEYNSIDDMLLDWLDKIKNNKEWQSILKDEIEFIENMKSSKKENVKMAKIWFRVGMEAEITEEEMKELLIYSGQIKGEYDCSKAHTIMENIIKRAELSGETYILGKDCGGVDDYDNPEKEVNFMF